MHSTIVQTVLQKNKRGKKVRIILIEDLVLSLNLTSCEKTKKNKQKICIKCQQIIWRQQLFSLYIFHVLEY